MFDKVEQFENMTKSKKRCLKASELIVELQKKIDEAGDLEITINTQEGSSYSIYAGDENVHVIPWYGKDGSVSKTIEIG